MKRILIISANLVVVCLVLSLVNTGAATNCGDDANQQELNLCAFESYQAADKELNSVYKKLVSMLEKNWDKKIKAKLVDAQKSWIAFRDKECDFAAAGFEGGSMQPLIYNGCLADLTRKRTAELKEHLNSFE